jgi:translation elongation factor EF-1beta
MEEVHRILLDKFCIENISTPTYELAFGIKKFNFNCYL